jgi:hypothetical protein
MLAALVRVCVWGGGNWHEMSAAGHGMVCGAVYQSQMRGVFPGVLWEGCVGQSTLMRWCVSGVCPSVARQQHVVC